MTMPERMPTLIAFYDVKLCNCAGCGRPIIGESMLQYSQPDFTRQAWSFVKSLKVVEARVADRPYCGDCARARGYAT